MSVFADVIVSAELNGRRSKSYLFYRPLYRVAYDRCVLVLTKPDGSANGLLLHGWIPLRLQNVNASGDCEVEAEKLLDFAKPATTDLPKRSGT